MLHLHLLHFAGVILGIAPWLMWGSTQNLSLFASGGTLPGVGSQQLARIDYARPETWTFFFAAVVNNAVQSMGPSTTANLFVSFDLTLGVGRSTITIPGFEQYVIPLDSTSNLNLGKTFYSAEVAGPPRIVGDVVPNLLRNITAQSINVNCTADLASQGVWAADISLTAYFAPVNHIRPEWFKDGLFTGGENAGL